MSHCCVLLGHKVLYDELLQATLVFNIQNSTCSPHLVSSSCLQEHQTGLFLWPSCDVQSKEI